MIRVLIVEDDKLARRGLIASMPWDKYEMEVVAQASNGREALPLIEEKRISLIMTDIAMPVMSGIELTREVKKRYPEVSVVFLTLHQDFQFVQEALRLGAIDYISKIQLEDESFDEVLSSIHDRVKSSQSVYVKAGDGFMEADSCFVVFSLDSQEHPACIEAIPPDIFPKPEEVGNGIWVYPTNGRNTEDLRGRLAAHLSAKEMVYEYKGLSQNTKKDFFHGLRKYSKTDLFYNFEPQSIRAARAPAEKPAVSDGELSAYKDKWLCLDWIFHRESLCRMLLELREKQLSYPRLLALLVLLESTWKQYYGFLLDKSQMRLPDTFEYWGDVCDWFFYVQEATLKLLEQQSLSPDLFACIAQSIHIIHEEMDQPLFTTEISHRVNMSRSYFCQCFKKVTGEPFNTYLRNVRLMRAKEYLSKTEQPIQWIAERVGFMDEKYFSKIFKGNIGTLPSKYRINSQIGNKSA